MCNTYLLSVSNIANFNLKVNRQMPLILGEFTIYQKRVFIVTLSLVRIILDNHERHETHERKNENQRN